MTERKMKDSGIPWIGMIPEEWEVARIKSALKWTSLKNHGNERVLSLYRDLGIVFKDERDDNHNVTSEKTDDYKFVEPGDFVINKMKAWQGSMAVSKYQGIVSPAYYVAKFINPKIYKPYFHYLLRDKSYTPEYLRLSTGLRVGQWDLPWEDFCNIKFLIPPYSEQERIAGWLDEKCGDIDELIDVERKMIETLEAYRQATITEAVTGSTGILPVYDENGNRTRWKRVLHDMRQTNISWLPQIPSHWKICRLKDVGKLYGGLTGKAGDDFNVDEVKDEYSLFVPFTNIFNNDKIDPHQLYKVKTSKGEKQNEVKFGDLLFLMSSEDYGGIGKSSLFEIHTELPVYLNSFCKGLRVDCKIYCPKFLNYLMMSQVGRHFCQMYANGFIRINLRQEMLSKCPILFPPIDEQTAIAEYLDAKCKEIDELIVVKREKIETLKQYRQSLIFEAVTGKIQIN